MIFAKQIQEKFSEFSNKKSKTRNEIQDKVAIEDEKINSSQKLLDEKILLEKTEFLMKENLPAIHTSHKCGTKWQQIATFDRKEKNTQKFEAVQSQINSTTDSRNTFNEKINLLISSKKNFDNNKAENSLESYVKKDRLGNKMNEIDSRLEKGVNKGWEDLESERDELNDVLAEKKYREDVKTRHEAILIRAWQRAGRPGPGILEPGFQNPGFFDPEKNLILNPEPGPDLKFSPETGPDPDFRVRAGFFAVRVEKPGPARKNSKTQKLKNV